MNPPDVGKSTINERIAELIKTLQMNKSGFANSIDKAGATIQTILNGRNKPGFDVIEAIFKKYPQVNRDWLIMGEGPMFRTAKWEHAAPGERGDGYLMEHLTTIEGGVHALVEQFQAQLAEKDRQIQSLQQTLQILAGKSEHVLKKATDPYAVLGEVGYMRIPLRADRAN